MDILLIRHLFFSKIIDSLKLRLYIHVLFQKSIIFIEYDQYELCVGCPVFAVVIILNCYRSWPGDY